jgi:hypothetical protein
VRLSAIDLGLLIGGLLALPPATTGAEVEAARCVRPTDVQRIVFSARKYPTFVDTFGAPSAAAGVVGSY